jgi:hypothetical protein
VNKLGPNKGKMFYLFVHLVRPGVTTDAAKGGVRRPITSLKCDVFKWVNDDKHDIMRGSAGTTAS